MTLQGLGSRTPLSTAKESEFRLELDSKEHNIHERLRGALLEAFTSHPSILQRTLDDVSSVFERVPKNGQAQKQLLKRFVSSRLDKRRQEAEGALNSRIGELSAHAVDSIGARTNRVVELETLNRGLRIRGGQSEARLRIKTAEAKEESEQLTKRREEHEDLRLNLQRATSDYNNAVDRSKAQQAALQSQLEVERKFHEAYQTRTAALEAEKQLFVESCADDALTIKRLLGVLSANMVTLQEETQTLRVELAEEHALRTIAEAQARSVENEIDVLRTGLESLLHCSPKPDRT